MFCEVFSDKKLNYLFYLSNSLPRLDKTISIVYARVMKKLTNYVHEELFYKTPLRLAAATRAGGKSKANHSCSKRGKPQSSQIFVNLSPLNLLQA